MERRREREIGEGGLVAFLLSGAAACFISTAASSPPPPPGPPAPDGEPGYYPNGSSVFIITSAYASTPPLCRDGGLL
ncbi:hypothetical protein CgunFtcFv8_022643 [Champsocephalus gunnari]|uniref:Uncharacterized protein n=1 Tax=Champsocephalus gunnari TaxID=52237 RepID=A0AAN8HSJ5_CHAGU|nr:hypothetical protein CgunFtcFv8_022643 [Champsocephalus gunnari]